MNPRILVIFATLLLTLPVVAHSAPDAATLKTDAGLLDGLERSYKSDGFGDKFNAASKRLADQRGPEIVHAVMLRSHQWKGEEGLVFVALVALLPRKPTLAILQQYQRSKQPSERLWAGEYITEFGMPDVQAGVKKISGSK